MRSGITDVRKGKNPAKPNNTQSFKIESYNFIQVPIIKLKNGGRLVDTCLLNKDGNRVKDASNFLIYKKREI